MDGACENTPTRIALATKMDPEGLSHMDNVT